MTELEAKYEFVSRAFSPERIFTRITDVRVEDPSLIEKSAQRRKRRDKLTLDGKLAVLACDQTCH